MWVFIYKVNLYSFLAYYYSKIIIQGDLQEEDLIISTYAFTLIAWTFKIIAALATYFDLKIK
jgi:hypothetical protein